MWDRRRVTWKPQSGQNNVTQLLPPGTPLTGDANYIPFPDFGAGMPLFRHHRKRSYNSLQTKWVHQSSKGLDLLVGYTLGRATPTPVTRSAEAG